MVDNLKYIGCKENQFYRLPFGQARLVRTSPRVTLIDPTKFLNSRIDYSSSSNLNSSQKFTCTQVNYLFVQLSSSPIAKSTRPSLLDNTFFAL